MVVNKYGLASSNGHNLGSASKNQDTMFCTNLQMVMIV